MKIRKFDVLVALYVFGIMVAELMGAKTFPIATLGGLHLHASVAIFVMPLLFTSVDLIVEVYGKERARSVVRAGLLVVILQVLTAWLFTSLPASPQYSYGAAAYQIIFGTTIRFGLASILAFAASEILDIFVFAKMRQKMQGKALWLRNNVANFASQLVDAVVWTSVAFYSFGQPLGNNVSFIAGVALPYYAVRCVLSIAETPLMYIGVNLLRSHRAASGGTLRAAGEESF
jgi:uncharacterized integral membrane protein (TIGR00697 family)